MISFGGRSDGADLHFVNLEDFMRKLNRVANEYPKTTEKHLRAIGNLLKRQVIAATPVGKTGDRYGIKNDKGDIVNTSEKTIVNDKGKTVKTRRSKVKLKNTWSGKTVGTSGADLEYQLRSKSKRYHLVERGHVKVVFGKRTTGFVQGRFFFRDTKEKFERSNAVEQEMKKMFREIQKRLEG